MLHIDSCLDFCNLVNDQNNLSKCYEKKLCKLRKAVNDLFFIQHFSKSKIAHKKKVSRNFVIQWTKSPVQDFMSDNRGWPVGKRRKWDKAFEQRVKVIHQSLANDPGEFYTGASAIVQEWRKRYPAIGPPPLRTIGRILAALGLSNKRKRGRNKGAARYLCYPEHTIYNLLGRRVLEADFLGRKHLRSRTEPLNFIGFSFKQVPKLRYFRRIEGQDADAFIKEAKVFFRRFELPDYMKVDNCAAALGSTSAPRTISRAIKFLLQHHVTPIFAVPRKHFSQASIEGNNSVFVRKFWNRIEFKNLEEVDEKLEWFNRSSQRYLGYQRPLVKRPDKSDFVPKVYFIRQVKEDNNQSFIEVLNETVSLPKAYTNYFVLAEWNLLKERLYVHFEKELKPKVIKKIAFKINPKSYGRIQKLLSK